LIATNVSEALERERYLFLAVCRAARRQLHLSYARSDEHGACGPSLYLNAVTTTLGFEEVKEDLIAAAETEPVEPPTPPLRRARRPRYGLAELAHFGLCPYRAKLERLDPRAHRYSDPFHVQFMAEATWLDRVFTKLHGYTLNAPSPERLQSWFTRAITVTRPEVADLFPGLRPSEWAEVERRVTEQLSYLAQGNRLEGTYPVTFEAPPLEATYQVTEGHRAVEIDATPRHAFQRGVFHQALIDDLLLEEWLIPAKSLTGVPQWENNRFRPVHAHAQGIQVFASQYDAVQWWRQTVTDAFRFRTAGLAGRPTPDWIAENYRASLADVAQLVASIEGGQYPKHPGDHCHFCPVFRQCLGK
jgi:hypothetical protein